jgi:glyoxylase I family protein
MPASIAFYRDVLGFEVVEHSPPRPEVMFHWALLRRDGTELMLNTAYDEGQRPAVRDRKRVAAHGDTGLFFGCPDVDAMYKYLHAKGIAKNPPNNACYGMRQLYVTDPDGYGICFQWPVKDRTATDMSP